MPSKPQIHPALECFRCPGGLFDVEPCEMDLNIGKRCRFTQAFIDSPSSGIIHQHPHRIIAVQKNYKGEKCYRVQVIDEDGTYGGAGAFGSVANPNEIIIED